MRSHYTENSLEFNEFLTKFIKKRNDGNLREIIQTLHVYASVEADPQKVYQLHRRFYSLD